MLKLGGMAIAVLALSSLVLAQNTVDGKWTGEVQGGRGPLEPVHPQQGKLPRGVVPDGEEGDQAQGARQVGVDTLGHASGHDPHDEEQRNLHSEVDEQRHATGPQPRGPQLDADCLARNGSRQWRIAVRHRRPSPSLVLTPCASVQR